MPSRPFPAGPQSAYPGELLFGLRGNTLSFLTQTARTYGDFVPFQIGPWLYVLVNDPEVIREVLVTRNDKFIKGPALRRASDTLGQGLLTSEGDFHKRQRRLSQPAFHPQRVAGYAADMVRISERTGHAWKPGQLIDVHEQMMQLTLRIVAKTIFDEEVEEEVDRIGGAMDVTVNMFTRAMNPFGPILNRLPLPSNFRFYKARNLLNSTIDRFIKERRTRGVEGRTDLLSVLLRATDDPETINGIGSDRPVGGMSDAQLRAESLTLFTAGHETTANALTFTWHLLGAHPTEEATLHREIDTVLQGKPPGNSDVDRLPYTRAVIAEAMRLYPPAWAVGREATEAVTLGDYAIEPRTIVLASQWVTHRDPLLWPDPQKFDPTRWLPGGVGADPNRPKYAYYPFGGGPRNCIGEAFAWTEAILVVATLAQLWKLKTLDKQPPALIPTITLRPTEPVWAKVETRRALARPLDRLASKTRSVETEPSSAPQSR